MERSHRLIDGPEQDLLNIDQIAKYLHLSPQTLRRLVRDGQFPRPIMISDGTAVWDWKDAVWWKLGRELLPRCRKSKKGRADNAQERSRPDQSRPSGKRDRPAD